MLTRGEMQGHPAWWLENDQLKVAVLPRKGADIADFTHKPSGVEFLMRTPAGLRPPGDGPQADFLENYEGGWQELFPNANDACQVGGQAIPFHGEVALLPWEAEVERDDEAETSLRLSVRCRRTPFRLERRMRLRAGEAALKLEEVVTNESDGAADFVWGHHVVLGGDFLGEGCRLSVPAERLATPDVLFEPATAALAPGQDEPWPWARGREPGTRVDLRRIPGPPAHAHDDVCLTGLAEGRLAVSNPSLRLTFELRWDRAVFPWIMLWQPYGGADLPPLTGIYGVGVEPWVSRYNLAGAIAHGQARRLGPRASLATALQAAVIEEAARPDRS